MAPNSCPTPFEGPGVLRGDEFLGAADLWDRAARAASGLESLGVGAGDTIALLLRNDHPYFEASYAAFALGAACVPLNWHERSDELGYVLDDAAPKILITHADLLPQLGDAVASDTTVIEVPTPSDVAHAYGVSAAAARPRRDAVVWHDWLSGFAPRGGPRPAPQMAMNYTSGTTGRPKGVRRAGVSATADELEVYQNEIVNVLGLRRGLRTVVTGPMYHLVPNSWGLVAAGLDGFVVAQVRFDAEELLALVERHRITHLNLVPTMFVRLLRLPAAVKDAYDLSSLEHVVHGAAPCPIDVKRSMIDWWGPIVHEYYGGSETGAVTVCDSAEWLAHPGTVGRPLATAVVRVVDEDGRVAAPGEIGEVFAWANGAPDFTYNGRPEDRQKCERDGLITCGDVGYLDGDGFLFLCDRKADMVITGGVNVYPAEIEACLLQLAAVSDCAVFGIPDPEFGEALAAAIQLEPGQRLTESDVRDYLRERLAAFKCPRVVTFHSELPREDTGKIFKRRLRDEYWAAHERLI